MPNADGEIRSIKTAKGADVYIAGDIRLASTTAYGTSTIQTDADGKNDGFYAKLSATTGAFSYVKLIASNPKDESAFHVEIGKVGIYLSGTLPCGSTINAKTAPSEVAGLGNVGYVALADLTTGALQRVQFGPATKEYAENFATRELLDGIVMTYGYRDDWQGTNLTISVGQDHVMSTSASFWGGYTIRYLNNLNPITP